MTKYTYSEWIEHDGNGMPVDGDVLVQVWYRSGGKLELTEHAGAWVLLEWEFSDVDPDNDITAYRIATPIKEPFYTSAEAMVRNPDDWEDEDA